jgi:hypothetical protein
MADTPKSAAYAVKNTSRGPRYVNTADGRQQLVEPGQTVENVQIADSDATLLKRGKDLELTKGGRAKPEKAAENPGGETQTAQTAQTTTDGGAGGEKTPAYVAHEGLGRYYAYTADGEKLGAAMKKEEAQSFASDQKIEFKGNAD